MGYLVNKIIDSIFHPTTSQNVAGGEKIKTWPLNQKS